MNLYNMKAENEKFKMVIMESTQKSEALKRRVKSIQRLTTGPEF